MILLEPQSLSVHVISVGELTINAEQFTVSLSGQIERGSKGTLKLNIQDKLGNNQITQINCSASILVKRCCFNTWKNC